MPANFPWMPFFGELARTAAASINLADLGEFEFLVTCSLLAGYL